MPPSVPIAGPSNGNVRVSNFFSDEEDDTPEDPLPLVNGSKKKRKLEVNGVQKKQKRKEDPEARRKRDEIAEELLQKRFELPFYQGEGPMS